MFLGSCAQFGAAVRFTTLRSALRRTSAQDRFAPWSDSFGLPRVPFTRDCRNRGVGTPLCFITIIGFWKVPGAITVRMEQFWEVDEQLFHNPIREGLATSWKLADFRSTLRRQRARLFSGSAFCVLLNRGARFTASGFWRERGLRRFGFEVAVPTKQPPGQRRRGSQPHATWRRQETQNGTPI